MDTKALNGALSRERAKLDRQAEASEATRATIALLERELAAHQSKK